MKTSAAKNQGLTTTKAPFIEEAKVRGDLFIRQPYELYNEENQEAWKRLYANILPRWKKYANSKFLKGLDLLSLSADRIPKLEEINRFLAPLTGFQAKAVPGFVPTYIFFDSLKKREFPTTITIRDLEKLNYLPEPDIFHDVAGHVPMHTDRTFADILVKFGTLAEMAVKRHQNVKNHEEKIAKITSNIQALSRFFWFTIEFGLMKEEGKLCVYGSGLLSSFAEIEYCIESSDVQRYPFQMEWVINQSFEIDRFQTLLFYIESFEQLFKEVQRLEEWLQQGRLDHVSPGQPHFDEEDLSHFLHL